MKWLPVDGSVQHGVGACGRRYTVVSVNSQHWVAYEMGSTTGEQLGVSGTDAKAREFCEDRERYHESLRRRA